MKSNVIEKFGDVLVQNAVISSEEKELFIFGLQQGLIMILNVITSILIGYLFGMVWQSIVFMITYIPLRSYVGGYHARTQLRCYLFSIVLMSLVLWGIKLIPWTSFICVIVSILIGIIIFIFAPRADENKPLDEIETIVFRKRARVIYCAQELILLVFLFFGWDELASCLVMTFVAMVLMLFLDILKHSYLKVRDRKVEYTEEQN